MISQKCANTYSWTITRKHAKLHSADILFDELTHRDDVDDNDNENDDKN